MARICPLIPLVSSEVETPRRRARPMGISTSLDANGHKMTAKSALLRAIRKSCKLRPFFYIGAHLAPPPRPTANHWQAPIHGRCLDARRYFPRRSEEQTSELQSLMRNSYAVFCLQKKKHIKKRKTTPDTNQKHQTVRRQTTTETLNKNNTKHHIKRMKQ